MSTRAVALTIPIIKESLDWVQEHQEALDLRDLACPGLVLRIAKSGVAAWSLRYGAGGRRIPLGRHPALTLKGARDASARHRQKIADGIDPRPAPVAQTTLKELAVRFRAQHIAHLAPRTQKEYNFILDERLLPHLGEIPVRTLDRPAVIRWHQTLGTKRYANFCLAVLSKMMSLAELWGEREGNPCHGVPRFQEGRRQRYLTPEEVTTLASVLDDSPICAGIRLLIFTGMRLGELLALRWDWIDEETGSVTFPASFHKTGRKVGAKTLPFTRAALEVLEGIPKTLGRPEVISATEAMMGNHWREIRRKAGIPDVRLHDLRHTFASWGASRGQSLSVIGALLGHRHAATTQRYAHLSQGPLREAVEQIGDALDAAMRKIPESGR